MQMIFAIAGIIIMITDSILGRVLIGLGMGLITFTGFNVLTGSIFNELKANMAGMPSEVLSFLAFMWVDKAINVVVSGVNAAIVIKLAGSTTLKKWVVTRPTI